MDKRFYYSVRTGKNQHGTAFDLTMLRKLFYSIYMEFIRKDYFQQTMGYTCVDDGFVAGTMGYDIKAYGLIKLRKEGLWPISEQKSQRYQEEDIFDLIEFLYDHVSKPVDGNYHSYQDCGWHYDTFDQLQGQEDFRLAINSVLQDYQTGWELTKNGEILSVGDIGLDSLLAAQVPSVDELNITAKVDAAIRKFRRHKSSMEDRKDAVRTLADVLEFIRPKAKEVLMSKDEADIFNLANNFGVRHHNPQQKTDYDLAIWLSWMFYYYLATIHATIRLIEKQKE